jgi:hypothetical protein
MAGFDIVSTAQHAYRIAWQERSYLMRLAMVPLLVKFIFYAISLHYVEPTNILRLSLIMLPAYFVEGWLLSHWIRTLIIPTHRWPFQPTGDEKKDLKEIQVRGRGIMSGAISYTLINLLIAGFFAYFMALIPQDINPAEANPAVAIAGVVMMALSFFLFRYVWLFIPLAVNVNLAVVMRKLKPLGLTFNLIGVWLVCFAPPIVTMYLIGGVLTSIGSENSLPVMDALIMFVRVALDMVKNILVVAGIAYAFIQILDMKIKK